VVEVITGTGLDANDVATLLAGAVKSDSALPENAGALTSLSIRVAEAQTGKPFEIADIVPKPRPDNVLAAASSPADYTCTIPKPRPAFDTAEAQAAPERVANLTLVLPKPRPGS
jgi:hypothetical protein